MIAIWLEACVQLYAQYIVMGRQDKYVRKYVCEQTSAADKQVKKWTKLFVEVEYVRVGIYYSIVQQMYVFQIEQRRGAMKWESTRDTHIKIQT